MITKITLGSVLKPIYDTRMYGKLGLSLAKMPNTEVFVFGQEQKKNASHQLPENIQVFGQKKFDRLSAQRWLNPFQYLRFLLKVKPDINIVNTHELLIVSIVYRILFGGKFIYDIRENYLNNIWANSGIYPILKPFIATWVRGVEIISSLWIDTFFLAESHYALELSFLGNRFLILENKYSPPETFPKEKIPKIVQSWRKRKEVIFFFSGTLATETGVFDTIDWIDRTHALFPHVKLMIAGSCPRKSIWKKLKKKIKDKPYIYLEGGKKYVHHHRIVQLLGQASCGMMLYQINDSNQYCVPTKLYEYMANALPIVSTKNLLWEQILDKYRAGIVLNPHDDPSIILQELKTLDFYSEGIPEEFFWESEEIKLKNYLSNTS